MEMPLIAPPNINVKINLPEHDLHNPRRLPEFVQIVETQWNHSLTQLGPGESLWPICEMTL